MKLKKWLLGLVTFAAMVVLCAVCAGAETYGDFEYSVLDDGTVKLTDYNGSAEKVDIPKMIDGKSVTSIKYNAFRGCTSLKSITIPNSVMSIGSSAFRGCTSLTSITIPNSVTSIESDAFGGCTSLTSITIPNSVTSIESDAFGGCTSLTAINVATRNQNYVSVNGVLYDKNKTVIIRYPAGKKDKSYSILDGVMGICACAFETCVNLESITLPDSVTVMGLSVFNGCKSLTTINVAAGNQNFVSVNGVLYDKDKTAIIRYPARKKDKNYNILNSVRFVHNNAFEDCTNLTSITIPNSVTSIESDAFGGCTSLTSIVIPKSVTSISFWAHLGYDNDYYQIDNFKIYCYSGTAGEKYAKDNRFNYEIITAEKPAKVTNFKVKSKTSTAVTMQWNKNSSASGYQLQQYKDGKWVTIYTGTKATNTSYTVNGLKAGTAGYRFRIRAYKTYGNTKQYGSWSSEVKVNTNPYGVGGFKCSSKTSTSVTLKWNKGTTASGYQLQQYKDGKWVTIYTGTKATNTSFTVKGLKAGTAGYRFRIRAYKTYGNTKQYGSWSSEVKVNTNPYGVGGFKAKSTAKNSITLGWNKGTTASGYQLQQYKGGKWVTVYTGTKATSTSCTIKSLKANTSYKFRIRAYKTYGNTKQYGSWSKVLTVRTKR